MTIKHTRAINLVADVVAPLAVVLVTIVLFFLFQPAEPGTLFWANMVYSVFLELILFAYMVWLPDRAASVALKWMCGVYSVIYICASLVWMLLFGLLLRYWCPVKVYFAVIAVLTVVWILIAALSLKVDNANSESVAEIRDNRRRADSVNGRADMLLRQFNLLLGKRPDLSTASRPVTSLCRGIATLSPAALADYAAEKRVLDICSGLEDLIADSGSEDLAIRLKDFADQSLTTLDYIKKTTRK